MSWNVYIWVKGAAGNGEQFEIAIDDDETLRRIEAAVEFGNPITIEQRDGVQWMFQGGEAVAMKAVKR